ncbi:MAG: dTDP-4-dehydrorhamnose 3,5-epimerase, partial [Thermoplasmatales archaeon]
MAFTFQKRSIPEVITVTYERHEDERGFFEETFKSSDFKQAGINLPFVQDNHSFSKKGILRGLHFQTAPEEQGKLVSVMSGRIFDVAVDIRSDSPYFGKWVSEELSSENRSMLWIPPGFAHGFVAIDDSHVIYKTTSEY